MTFPSSLLATLYTPVEEEATEGRVTLEAADPVEIFLDIVGTESEPELCTEICLELMLDTELTLDSLFS